MHQISFTTVAVRVAVQPASAERRADAPLCSRILRIVCGQRPNRQHSGRRARVAFCRGCDERQELPRPGHRPCRDRLIQRHLYWFAMGARGQRRARLWQTCRPLWLAARRADGVWPLEHKRDHRLRRITNRRGGGARCERSPPCHRPWGDCLLLPLHQCR